MNSLTIIIGAGGTGSYFIPNILRELSPKFLNNKVIVLDGDFLETRNLLRQGFYKQVINNSKSEAMFKMYGSKYKGLFECNTRFLNYADEILNIVSNQIIDYEEIVLVSCVDNNMARLRLLLAQNMIKQAYPDKSVLFLDSGNEEWFGQTIISYMGKDDSPILTFTKNNFIVHEENIHAENQDYLFTHMSEWQTKLTKGDHEVSCDVVAEISPQNIATNMMAGNILAYTYSQSKQNIFNNIYFDCKQNKTNILPKSNKDLLLNFYKELVDYLNSELVSNVLSPLFLINNEKSENIFIKKSITIEKPSQEVVVKVPFSKLVSELEESFIKKDENLLDISDFGIPLIKKSEDETVKEEESKEVKSKDENLKELKSEDSKLETTEQVQNILNTNSNNQIINLDLDLDLPPELDLDLDLVLDDVELTKSDLVLDFDDFKF